VGVRRRQVGGLISNPSVPSIRERTASVDEIEDAEALGFHPDPRGSTRRA